MIEFKDSIAVKNEQIARNIFREKIFNHSHYN